MQPTIIIRKEEKQIKINFSYNTDIVDIMREHNGYFFRKEKAWCFPIRKLDEIRDELAKKMYTVQTKKAPSTPTKPTYVQKKINVFDDPDVISVGGICKKCNTKTYIDEDGLCVRCK